MDHINEFFIVAIYLLVSAKKVLMSTIGCMLIRENSGMQYQMLKITQIVQKKSEIMTFIFYDGILAIMHTQKKI